MATVHADEASHWDALHGKFDTRRINHTVEYSNEWACTNQAESFFSRLRRMEVGTHHHIAGPYLAAYAGEASWREDNRRMDNGSQSMAVAAAAMESGVSRRDALEEAAKVADDHDTFDYDTIISARQAATAIAIIEGISALIDQTPEPPG